MTPLKTSRMSTSRLRPPGFASGISGSRYVHSSSVTSLGYLRRSRLYFARFLSVHIGGPSTNQAAVLESQVIQGIQELSRRTLRRGRLLSRKSINELAGFPRRTDEVFVQLRRGSLPF